MQSAKGRADSLLEAATKDSLNENGYAKRQRSKGLNRLTYSSNPNEDLGMKNSEKEGKKYEALINLRTMSFHNEKITYDLTISVIMVIIE